jgi:hypothetical protein
MDGLNEDFFGCTMVFAFVGQIRKIVFPGLRQFAFVKSSSLAIVQICANLTNLCKTGLQRRGQKKVGGRKP